MMRGAAMSTMEELEKVVKGLGDRLKKMEGVIAKDVVVPLKEHEGKLAEHAKRIAKLEPKQKKGS
jgi:hypothetical protein